MPRPIPAYNSCGLGLIGRKRAAAEAAELAAPGFHAIKVRLGYADASGLPISSHLFPEISAHLLAASPTCHWLEYVDWADPILQEPLRVQDGFALVPETPGCGMAWNASMVERCLAA